MSSQQKISESTFKVNGTLLLITALLFWTVPGSLRAEEILLEDSDVITAPCKELKPYNNIEELLYQFYINKDSDCLFNMSAAELGGVVNKF